MKQPVKTKTPADTLYHYLLTSSKLTATDYIVYTKKEEKSTVIQLQALPAGARKYTGNYFLDN